MVTFKQKGNFGLTKRLFEKWRSAYGKGTLDKYGQEGCKILAAATPVDTGKTASSWHYEITSSPGKMAIEWYNDNVNDGVPIAAILQYGHATRGGTWYSGIDYVNPAMKPLFDKISSEFLDTEVM